MKYEIYVGDPAGNITIFVKTSVEKENYIQIANTLMADNEYNAEQVGYITKPIAGGEGRLEMMGGEFCGNATRLFGYLLGSKKTEKIGEVLLEVTGSKELLKVKYDTINETATTEMPFPLKIEKLNITDLDIEISVVMLDGISHAIVENHKESEELTNAILKEAKNKYTFDAFGIMYVNGVDMIPIVYVSGTNSLIYEGSCGSGTMAYCVYLASNQEDGLHEYEIKQPGGIVSGRVCKENNEIVSCFIGGKVKISNIIDVEI